MRSLALSIGGGVVAALVLHIISILAIPYVTEGNTWSRIVALGDAGRFYSEASLPEPAALLDSDPYVKLAVCRFEMTNVPIRITASANVFLWTLSIFDEQSNEIYSMNDSTAIVDTLDVILANPAGILSLRRDQPETGLASIFVETSASRGYIVLRAVVPSSSWQEIAEEFLASARCGTTIDDPS